MAELGKYNQLRIVKEVDFGVYLDGGDGVEILLPTRYLPPNYAVDESVDVFIYRDSEDRLIATTETPYAQVGEFAYLEAKAVNSFGAFLDWGLMKDLFVPFKEQKEKMRPGYRYIVYLYIDQETDRITASAKTERYLSKEPPPYQGGEKVNLLICQYTDLGYKAIIEHTYSGVLYENEVFKSLRIGDRTEGYIKQVREDHKIDLMLYQPGYGKIGGVADDILAQLEANNGFLPLTDKSDAETIYSTFSVSKKNFKKALGDLYKRRLIQLTPTGILLIQANK